MTEYTIEQRIIYRLVEQHCTMPDGELFSGFLSANAAAMRYLAEIGLLVISREGGRGAAGTLHDLPPELYDLGDFEG